MSQHKYRNFRLATDIDDVVWLTLDRADEKVNSLSQAVLDELQAIVTRLESEPPAGLVLESGKHDSFIVGADIREFEGYEDAGAATDAIHAVHRLFNRIEALPFPTAVCIDGLCLGGGLELALAFDYRIASDVEHTRLGYPEINLGIYPGFGGSARSVRQAGAARALTLMLTGRNLRPGAARAMGLVDELVGAHGSLRWAARRAVLEARKSRRPNPVIRLQNLGLVRPLLARMMRKKVAAKADPKHYPAPYELIDAWERFGDDPHRMMTEEAERVGRLVVGDTSRNLRRVFGLMERLKAIGKEIDFPVRRVHVIGAGVMGGDIAAWCTLQGLEVTLQDRGLEYVEAALERAGKLFRKKLGDPHQVTAALGRLLPDIEGKGLARADVVIEAIFEDTQAKQDLFKTVEPQLRKDAVLATNTSAIPLNDLSSVLVRPDRLVGIHFFNPVAKMPLVEVVHAENTGKEHVKRAAAFCGRIKRFPLPVESSPGFLVNRVLSAYMSNAMHMHLERQLPIEVLDAAAESFGMPMGPVELADTVGLDVCLQVLTLLAGENASRQAELLRRKVADGALGRKTGQGFYTWEKGKPKRFGFDSGRYAIDDISSQLMQPYLDACQSALADGIVSDADLLDAGMVFGTGFAPFRGGPLHYLRQEEMRHD